MPYMKVFCFIVFALTLFSCNTDESEVIPVDNGNSVEINIDDSAFQQLERYRVIALKNGVIDKSLKKYVRGTISYKGNRNAC